jgi:NAD(P) transhydrogenase
MPSRTAPPGRGGRWNVPGDERPQALGPSRFEGTASTPEALAKSLTRSGARLILGGQVESVGRDAEGLLVRVDGENLRPQVVLHAVGRTGNVEGLGLEDAGVEVDGRGRIRVDPSYRTTSKGIYAAGDVIGPPGLASVSLEQARVAMCRAFGIPFKESVDPLVPTGIYPFPRWGWSD